MSKNTFVGVTTRSCSGAPRLLALTGLLIQFSGAAVAMEQMPAEETGDSSGSLAEVVVTAERREERVVDVPISVTSVSGETLAAAGISGTMDLQQAVPGLRFDESGTYVVPTIRGIGSQIAGPGATANVPIYVDGFYEPNMLGSDFELLSIDRVDVLKGPQGTLFGRNATGGAITIATREPTHVATGELDLQYGSFGRMKASTYVGGGLTDTLAADFTGFYEKGDGYIRNALTGEDAADFEKYTLRTKLVWTPTEAARIAFIFEHRYVDDPLPNATNSYEGLSFANTVPGTPLAQGWRDYTGTAPYRNTFRGDAGMLRADFDLGFAKLSSYTQYRDESSLQGFDYDASPLDVFAASWRVTDTTMTQEFNLSSSSPGKFTWVAGLFWYQNVNRFPEFTESVGGAPYFTAFASRVTASSYAAFGDGTYQIADNLFLTAGVRANSDHASASFTVPLNAAGDQSETHTWSAVTPRAVLRYKLTPDSNVYASFTQGYKSGIIPILQSPPTPVSPEKVNAYELGYKLAASSISFDSAVFYYKYRDLQVQAYQGTVSTTENAARSTIYGLDTQLKARLGAHVTVRAGVAYTHARYDSFPGAEDYVQDTNPGSPSYGVFLNPAVDASNNPMLRSPDWTETLGIAYTVPVAKGELALNADFYASSKFYFDPPNRFSQDAYQLLNLRATWTAPSNHWSISLYGTNVTNEQYRTEVLPGPFAIQQTYGEPAAVGVTATVKF